MPAPFGFSIGDVIAASILIKDVLKALDDTSGAAAEYQELCRELLALDRALLEVESLSRSCDTSIELNALSHTVRRVADQCKECIEAFLKKIKGYERGLRNGGSGNKLCDMGRKVRWALIQKGELATFRTEINGYSSTINMLLITANINLTKLTGKAMDARLEDSQYKSNNMNNQQLAILSTVQDMLGENERQLQIQGTNSSRLMERLNYFITLGANLKSLMGKIWTLSFKTYNIVVDLQSRIPKELGPCWIQEPVILTDALGRVTPIHLELINSWDVFDSVLAARFINLPGEGKIARREYAIHEQNIELDVQRTQPFTACFLPGRRLDMMVVFQNKNDSSDILKNSCPSCKTDSKGQSSSMTKCTKCGTLFQRITDLDEVSDPRLPESDYLDSGSDDMGELLRRPRKRNARFECLEEDDIRVFKRVRILQPSHLDISGEIHWPRQGSEAIPCYSDAHRKRAAPPGRCHSCNRADTPEWRRGPDGARTLCNGCGLHYAKLTRKLTMQSKGSFRPSKHEWEAAADWLPIVFKTSTFNSRFNTAHYNNPNFHPEEWTETESAGDLSPRRE